MNMIVSPFNFFFENYDYHTVYIWLCKHANAWYLWNGTLLARALRHAREINVDLNVKQHGSIGIWEMEPL